MPRFIALVKNRVSKCYLTDIISNNEKNLLVEYGTISLDEVKRARDARNALFPCPSDRLSQQMLFHFIYSSIGSLPLQKISTKLEEKGQDGTTSLKIVLGDTFVATQAHTFKVKEQLYDLQIKAFK